MTKVTAVLDAMADAIRDAIDASDLYEDDKLAIQVEPRRVLNPTPPVIDIYPADPFTDDTFAGFGEANGALVFTVRARIDTSDHDASQNLLLALMDDEDELSVAAALENDQTLASIASVDVLAPSGYTFFEDVAGQAFLGVSWRVAVVRARS